MDATMTTGERLNLAMRMSATSDQRIIDAETAKREGRNNAAFELVGEAQGWVDASRMLLEPRGELDPLETLAHFSQRVATELGYWSEICRQTAAALETEGYPAEPAWAARDTYDKAARLVMKLAENES